MVRHLVAPVLLAVLIPPAFAQPCVPCPQGYGVVILPAPLPGCLPAMGVVENKLPVIVPERMEAPKKEKEKGVQLDPPKKDEFATPKPADTPKPPPVKPDPEKIVPVIGEKIAPPGVPPLPPSKSDFDFVPPLTDPKTDDKPKPVEAPKPPEKLQPFDIPLPKPGDAQPVEANKPTVAKSSPLADERAAVDIYPRAGAAAGKGRAVTFVNKSSRDILLTVDGKTTTLPSKTVMTAELGEKFKWQIGGEAERTETVPDGRSGVDVVIRK